MNRKIIISFLVSVLFIGGCTTSMGPVSPTPNLNIDRDKSQNSVRLQLDPSIKDSFVVVVHSARGIGENIEVSSWHESIKSGFTNGFSRLFKIVDGDNSDFTIRLRRADLSFEDHTIDNQGGTDAVITYRVELVDKAGQKIKGAAKIARSKSPFSFKGQEGAAAKSALEDMYEQLGQVLF